jgi:hypothetical protein
METPPKKLTDAVKVLNDYFRVLSERIAEEITQNKHEFASTADGQAEALLDKFAKQVQRLNTVYRMLQGEARRIGTVGKRRVQVFRLRRRD